MKDKFTATNALIDKAAAELVEELLESTRSNTALAWFPIARRKMMALWDDMERIKIREDWVSRRSRR